MKVKELTYEKNPDTRVHVLQNLVSVVPFLYSFDMECDIKDLLLT